MRIQFYDTITNKMPDGTMIALSGVAVTVYNRGQSTRPNIWARESDPAPIPNSSFITVDGVLDFWVDPGAYELHFEDTVSPARVDPNFKITWEALPASDNTIPGAKIADVSIDEDKLAQLVGSSFAQALINKLFAPGDTKMSYQLADHAGWLLMNGRTNLLVSDYPALGALMQARGFVGIDVNHFGIPDYSGRMPVGVGSHPDVSALTSNDGITVVGNRRPRHKHSGAGSGSTSSDGSHSHPIHAAQMASPDSPNWPNLIPDSYPTGKQFDTSQSTDSNGTHSHGVNTTVNVGPQTGAEPTDSGAFQATNFFIKI